MCVTWVYAREMDCLADELTDVGWGDSFQLFFFLDFFGGMLWGIGDVEVSFSSYWRNQIIIKIH